MQLIKRNIGISFNIDLSERTALGWPHYLFLAFWILKQFYIRPSGTVQFSDMVFILSFGSMIISNRGKILAGNDEMLFLLFLLSVVSINLTYYFMYRDFSFVLNSVYYIYNLLIILTFSFLMQNKLFLLSLLKITIGNLMFQLIVFLSGVGRYYHLRTRYMGTFNDPNQFSFYVFASFLLVYILAYHFWGRSIRHLRLVALLAFIVSVLFVFMGSSTGALMGVLVFLAAFMLAISYYNNERARIVVRYGMIVLFIFAAGFIVILLSSSDAIASIEKPDTFLFQRLIGKITNVSNDGLSAILKEREISRLFDFPTRLLFGAGEGYFGRFSPRINLEIHSTFFGLWFYYGTIPVIFLIAWIRKKISGIPIPIIPVYISLLFESMILANQRQPILWMLILLGSLQFDPNSKDYLNGFKVRRKI